jgi:two-component system NtrC family sensor kinase
MAAPATDKRTKAKFKETESLAKISAMVNRSLKLNTILASALDEILKRPGMDAGILYVRPGPESLPITVSRGFSRKTAAFLKKNCDEATPPARDTSKWDADKLKEVLRRDGLKNFAFHPICAGNRVLGNLSVAAKNTKAAIAAHDRFISAISEILGVAIMSSRIREQSGKLSEDLIALQEVNKIISQGFNLEDIIHRIVIEGKRLAKASQCHLFLLDEQRECLVGTASTQSKNLDIRKVKIRFAEPSTAVTALVEKRVIAVGDIPNDERTSAEPVKSLGWGAAIFAPLLTKEQAIGVLVCSDDSRERKFTDEEILRAETLAHQAAIALENARLFQVVSRGRTEWVTTFDAMQDCVSVHDTTGKVIRANLALARRLRTTPQKVIGRYCSEIYDPSGSSSIPCRHMRSLKSKSLIVEEVSLPDMGGEFQISVSPWYDRNSQLTGSIHVAKDVSNEKLLQQQLIQSEKLSAIGELISGIAHELNNPLTGVMGYSELLQMRQDLDARAKESLFKINNLALRCQKIVQNLLSFARKQKPERTLSDINQILESTVELRSYELQVNNIQISRELDRNLPKTIADAHQLQQVFLNVLTNGEQAMLEAHGKGHFTIRTRTNGQKTKIIVEISDDGPGIPERNLTRIFDPFFTTKEVGKGTGLGLSISYGTIKEHGGDIYARSRLGKGTTFFIELPVIARLQNDTGAVSQQKAQGRNFDEVARGKRVLVVDDEQYILDFFVEVFQSLSMPVETAANGRTALEKMRLNEYDLIVTDFKMPQMSGRDLFDWIKENRPRLAPRIIFVTGDTVSPETYSFFEDHGSRYLAKPFKIDEVKEVIRQVLDRESKV